MKYWITTDTHFGHEKIKEYSGRPDNYASKILKGFMAIPEEDILIHLGDVCIGKDEYHHDAMMSHLKCRKWLVKGNHDRKSNGWYLNHGWDFVADGVRLEMFGKKILLSHIPQSDDGWYEVNVHGHLHEKKHREAELTEKHILVSLELQGYTPQRLQALIQSKSNPL